MTASRRTDDQAQRTAWGDWALSLAEWLRPRAPERPWKALLAFIAALLTYLAAAPLMLRFPDVQLGLLCGLTAALLAQSGVDAAIAAAAAFLLGWAVHLPFLWNLRVPQAPVLGAIVLACLAGALAAGLRRASVRFPWSQRAIVWLALGLLVANLWVTTYSANSAKRFDAHLRIPLPTTWQELRGELPKAFVKSDDAMYIRVAQEMRAGRPFYPTLVSHLRGEGYPRGSVFNFRQPAMFWVWSAMPDPTWVVPLFLVFATAAILAVPLVHAGTVQPPFAIVGAAALASYLLYFSVGLGVMSVEPWAGALGVLSLAALVTSYRSPRWRLLTVAAVALAVLGAFAREMAVVVVIAGLASAMWPSAQRRFRLIAWGTGLGVFALGYAAHALAVRPYMEKTTSGMHLAGPVEAVRALVFGSLLTGEATWVPAVLAVLGIIGTVALARRGPRTFAVLAVFLPLVAFMLISNGARAIGAGRINYWGGFVDPLIMALIPSVFRLWPFGAATPAETGAGPA